MSHDEMVLFGRNDAVDIMNTIGGEDASEDELEFDKNMPESGTVVTNIGWTCVCGHHNKEGWVCGMCGAGGFHGWFVGVSPFPGANEETCPHCTAHKPINAICPACQTTEDNNLTRSTSTSTSVNASAATVSQQVSFDDKGPTVSVSTKKRSAKTKVTARRKTVKSKASHKMKLRSSERKLRSALRKK